MRVDTLNTPITITVNDGSYTVEKEVDYKPKLSLELATEKNADIVEALPLEQYVSLYRQREAQTAQSTLDMCRVVYEARLKLTEGQFAEFCEQIGYKKTSSAIRKFIAIGRVAPRLAEYAEQLPNTWTNIYLITQLPADVFNAFMERKGSLRDLRGKYLTQLVAQTKPINSFTDTLAYDKKEFCWQFATVSFTKRIDDLDLRAIEKAFAEVASRLPVKFTINSDVQRINEARKQKRYEAAKNRNKNEDFNPTKWDLGQEANTVAQAVTSAAKKSPQAANDELRLDTKDAAQQATEAA